MAYRPDFAQQHVHTISSQRNHSPVKSYQGIKTNISTDSFMMAHTRKAASATSQTARTVYNGGQTHVSGNSYTLEHAKRVQESRGPLTKPRAPGAIPHVHTDTFMGMHVQKNRSISPPGSTVRNKFNLGDGAKPHIMADAWSVRVTRTNASKPMAPIRHSDSSDSYMFYHIKKIASYSPHRQRPQEVRL